MGRKILTSRKTPPHTHDEGSAGTARSSACYDRIEVSKWDFRELQTKAVVTLMCGRAGRRVVKLSSAREKFL